MKIEFPSNCLTMLEIIQEILTDEEFLKNLETVKNVIVESLKNCGRLYIAGNGGSAADANHLAAELVGKYKNPRNPIPAESLNSDVSVLTCIANDFGYEEVFSRQLEAKATGLDIFLAISTSGNSQNILKAMKHISINYYRKDSPKIILLSGKTGGMAKEWSDYSILVPSDETAIIQQVHQIIYHSLVESIENELFR